jgi:prepilin-type N-terminal cleavage/methylation domain-containing protein
MKTNLAAKEPGFTLVELLVTLGVVSALATASIAAVASMRSKAGEVSEINRMRQLGVAVIGWAAEHQGRPPRSSHSAIGHGELGWQREILPWLGYPDTSRASHSQAKPREFGIDPKANSIRSPALNVYFELNPDYDDYEGAPQSWRNLASLPNPTATILLIMAPGNADHVMAQYFAGQVTNHPCAAQGRRAGAVVWADGSTTLEAPGSAFDSSRNIDRFHPLKAR